MQDTQEPQKTMDEKTDEILAILQRMDRRDSMRMVGSVIRSLLGLIPLLLLLWSTWYLIVHGEEFIQRVTEQTVKNTIGISGKAGTSPPSLQQLLNQLQGINVK